MYFIFEQETLSLFRMWQAFNNKIKVLKRISYGVRNFKYFRNRIL